MARLAIFRLEDGESFAAEIDMEDEALVTMRGGLAPATLVAETGQNFQSSLQSVRSAAEAIVTSLSSMAKLPDEVTVEFGLKLSAEAGIVVAKASTEASFSIQLKWTKATVKGD